MTGANGIPLVAEFKGYFVPLADLKFVGRREPSRQAEETRSPPPERGPYLVHPALKLSLVNSRTAFSELLGSNPSYADHLSGSRKRLRPPNN